MNVMNVALMDYRKMGYRKKPGLLTTFGWLSVLALVAVVLGVALAFAV